jgi:hypothetical protein
LIEPAEILADITRLAGRQVGHNCLPTERRQNDLGRLIKPRDKLRRLAATER